MFTLIEKPEDLMVLNEELLQCSYVAIDTEFRRTTKDNMKLALMQINDSNEIYLIDCLQIDEPNSICSFLSSLDITKIFHSCREDVEAIYSWANLEVLNIYDTQIANSLLGGSFSISYQGLVKEKINLMINKDETRTNWLRRPLTEAQLNYAASDVYYLIDLYRLQIEEFSKTNKLEWLEEELNKPPSLNSFIELASEKTFNITKKEVREILSEFDIIVKNTSRIEDINPTLFFSKQNQKILLGNTLTVGVENALKGITEWRRRLIKISFAGLMRNFGVL
jgi:ribonuclease D